MIKVDEKVFYSKLYSDPKDIITKVRGRFPYTVLFKYRATGTLFGKTVDYIPEGKALPESDYYLEKEPSL